MNNKIQTQNWLFSVYNIKNYEVITFEHAIAAHKEGLAVGFLYEQNEGIISAQMVDLSRLTATLDDLINAQWVISGNRRSVT